MQSSPAIFMEALTISSGERFVWRMRARAAAMAKLPPDPMPRMPSSGSMTSPWPEMRSVDSWSATIIMHSRRRSMRSVRQSLASSIEALRRFLGVLASCVSKCSRRARASAAPPAKPARTGGLSLIWMRLILTALDLAMASPSVTWPSPPMATLSSRLTQRMVVERIWIFFIVVDCRRVW